MSSPSGLYWQPQKHNYRNFLEGVWQCQTDGHELWTIGGWGDMTDRTFHQAVLLPLCDRSQHCVMQKDHLAGNHAQLLHAPFQNTLCMASSCGFCFCFFVVGYLILPCLVPKGRDSLLTPPPQLIFPDWSSFSKLTLLFI